MYGGYEVFARLEPERENLLNAVIYLVDNNSDLTETSIKFNTTNDMLYRFIVGGLSIISPELYAKSRKQLMTNARKCS
jgi:hypothetical protein